MNEVDVVPAARRHRDGAVHPRRPGHDARRPRRGLQRRPGGPDDARRERRLPRLPKFGGNLVGLVVAALAARSSAGSSAGSTTRFRLDQFVIGLALFFAATGIASLLYKVVIGVTLQPPLIPTLDGLEHPAACRRLPVSVRSCSRSRDGLLRVPRLRSASTGCSTGPTTASSCASVGENPKAADSLGVNVARTRIWCSDRGWRADGLAGAYLPMTYTGTYTEGIVGGPRLARHRLAFFGGWRPQYILAGSAFFAGMEVLALRVAGGRPRRAAPVHLDAAVRRDPARHDVRAALGEASRPSSVATTTGRAGRHTETRGPHGTHPTARRPGAARHRARRGHVVGLGRRPRRSPPSPAARMPPSSPPRRAAPGCDEAVITGEGRIRGRRVAVVAGEFSLPRRVDRRGGRRADRRRPSSGPGARSCRCFAAPVSGGTRMQEGTVAFVQMVKITAADGARTRRPGCPTSSTCATRRPAASSPPGARSATSPSPSPGALIGFLGPRVYEALYGRAVPDGRADRREPLRARPHRRASCPSRSSPRIARPRAERARCARDEAPARRARAARSSDAPTDVPTPGTSITRVAAGGPARRAGLLKHGATDVLPLHGTGAGRVRPRAALALARFGGAPCVVLGQDRRGQTLDAPARPRRAARRPPRHAPRRRARPAAGHRRSTPPARRCRSEAEEGGLAGEIARCLADLVTLRRPTLCRAARPGHRRRRAGPAARRPGHRAPARLAVAAAARGRLGDPAPRHRPRAEIAAAQRVRSLDLLRDGIVDRIVAEHPDAADEPEDFCRRMSQTIQHELAVLAREELRAPARRPPRPLPHPRAALTTRAPVARSGALLAATCAARHGLSRCRVPRWSGAPCSSGSRAVRALLAGDDALVLRALAPVPDEQPAGHHEDDADGGQADDGRVGPDREGQDGPHDGEQDSDSHVCPPLGSTEARRTAPADIISPHPRTTTGRTSRSGRPRTPVASRPTAPPDGIHLPMSGAALGRR